jgi:hypothetical protein
MTILFSATPLAASWKTAVFGQTLDDAVRRPEQVVYSLDPSVMALEHLGAPSDERTVVELKGADNSKVSPHASTYSMISQLPGCCTMHRQQDSRTTRYNTTHPVNQITNSAVDSRISPGCVLGRGKPARDSDEKHAHDLFSYHGATAGCT